MTPLQVLCSIVISFHRLLLWKCQLNKPNNIYRDIVDNEPAFRIVSPSSRTKWEQMISFREAEFKWRCQPRRNLSMGDGPLEIPPLINTRVSIMEKQQLIILVTWPRSHAKIYCDVLAILPSWFFPSQAYELESSCLACSCMGVDAHTCLMSHSHLQHPGKCQDRYSPPRRLTGGEGKLWMTKSCISNHWATWLQRGYKKKHTAQGGCSKQVIHK